MSFQKERKYDSKRNKIRLKKKQNFLFKFENIFYDYKTLYDEL